MLYQPTNIYPSMIGALGNGVIDTNYGIRVSWQVNGNSPMTAFQITIYENNTTSTQLFSTGKLIHGCPFYGVDYAGNVQRFSYSISSQQLALAQIKNGHDYKIIIQQWWSDTDSVTQSSASVFRARNRPFVELGEIPKPLTSRSFSFTADYTQQQSDALNWIRWELMYASNGAYITIEDTGTIYGSNQFLFNYDGFLTGNTYAIRCSVQTENGVEASSEMSFFVQYETKPIQGSIATCQSVKGNGIKVSLPKISDVPGLSSGTFKIQDSYLITASDKNTMIKWSTKNNAPLSISQPFDICWKWKWLPDGDALSFDVKASVNGFEPSKVADVQNVYPFGANGCACNGEDKYVVITADGKVAYSDDCENWAYSQIGSSAQNFGWNGLAHEGLNYYAVSGAGKSIAKSQNLTNWTVTNVGVYLTAVGVSTDKIIAVGDGAVITKYHSDTASWVKATVEFDGIPTSVACGSSTNARYVIGTDHGALYYSTDGTTWTLATSEFEWISSITYAGGKFYAALYGSNNILSSSDGVTWNVAGSISEFKDGTDSIAYDGNGKLYATGLNTGTYAYSNDSGKTWSVFPCDAIEERAFVFNTGDTSGVFIVGNGRNGDTPFVYAGKITTVSQPATITARFSTSIDFTSFENAMPSQSNWRDVCYGGGKFVAVATDSNTAAYSTTGKEWSASTLHETATNWQSVCYGNGMFLAGGAEYFASSTDAINWTTISQPASDINCVRFLNGNFYAVGYEIYRSSDGNTWERCSIGSFDTYSKYQIMSIAYGNGVYVCVANGYSLYSYDGLNWSVTTMPQGIWNSVSFGNGTFTASGSDAYSVYSSNGKTWASSSTRSRPVEGFGLCFGDGRFIAATIGGVLKSVDGHTWDVIEDYSDREYSACCFGGGKFLIVGNNTGVLLSDSVTANVDFLMNGGRIFTTSIPMPYVQQGCFIFDCENNSAKGTWTTNGENTTGGFGGSFIPITEVTSVSAGGAASTDFIFISAEHLNDETQQKFENWKSPYHPYDIPRNFYADFTSDLNGDSFGQSYFTQFAIYRVKNGTGYSTHIFDSKASDSQTFIDAGARNNETYQYTAVGLSDFDQSSAITSSLTQICVWDWAILSCTEDSQGIYHPQKIFAFGKNLSSGDISNNNTPEILQNFTRYPAVQLPPFNYKSGAVTSLIGTISNGVYSDTLADRDEIMELSTTKNTIFLKSRKGDLLKIRVSGAIEFGTMDNSPTQAQTVKIPWVEVGDATTATVIITESDGAWPY